MIKKIAIEEKNKKMEITPEEEQLLSFYCEVLKLTKNKTEFNFTEKINVIAKNATDIEKKQIEEIIEVSFFLINILQYIKQEIKIYEDGINKYNKCIETKKTFIEWTIFSSFSNVILYFSLFLGFTNHDDKNIYFLIKLFEKSINSIKKINNSFLQEELKKNNKDPIFMAKEMIKIFKNNKGINIFKKKYKNYRNNFVVHKNFKKIKSVENILITNEELKKTCILCEAILEIICWFIWKNYSHLRNFRPKIQEIPFENDNK